MKKLKKSVYNKKFAGICGGLGDYYNIDANLIRVIFLILFGYISILLVIYIILYFIIPNEDSF